MSQRTYNQLWAEALLDLNRLLYKERQADTPRPEKDRVLFFQRVAMLYVRYIQILRKLEEVYDQVVHPQKRMDIRAILDSVMGRIMELKNEMVDKEYSEYHYVDDVVQDLKLRPEDLDIVVPRYFLSECSKESQALKTMLVDIVKKVKEKESDDQQAKEMTLEEAIKIIQVVERARQGRLRAKLNLQSRNMNRIYRTKDPGTAGMESAAICIQKVWRGYVQKRRAKIAREEEKIFLKMAMHPQYLAPQPAETAALAIKDATRVKQAEYYDDYLKSIEAVTKHLREVESQDMSDALRDQIRQWFLECRYANGAFPDFPPEEFGGSSIIFSDKDPQQLMEELAAKEKEEAKDKKSKEEKKEKGGKGKEKEKGKEEVEEEEVGLRMLPSAFISELQEEHKTYKEFWKNRNEANNFYQRHEVELIKEEKRKIVELEVRLKVDEQMRKELAEWKLNVDKDKGKGGKKGKGKKGGKGGKKKKKEKDLTAERTLESLCEELAEQGLLKLPKNVKIRDYVGDYSYLGTTLRQNDIEPMPSLTDVRQVLSLYAILPLGAQVLHERSPLIKSILLAGPAGVGKKMLVHAVCQETGATLFDLSPLNTTGKYPGKPGLSMMMHMVFKVAKLMQPSVIWIGEAEKMFYKKVPKEEKEMDPRRLKKDMLKSLKQIKGEDRVLIMGTTKSPLLADIKSLGKMFNKIILIPRPDYGSRCILWKALIEKQGGELTKALDLSSLAKISDGYTAGHMVQVIQTVITKRRILQQARKPLTAAEFVGPLAKIDPVFKEEEEALKNWYTKTPLGKKRIKAANEGKEEEGEVPEKEKDAKKGKK